MNRLCLFIMNNNHNWLFFVCLDLSVSPPTHVCAISLLPGLSESIALAAAQRLAEWFVSTNGL